MQTHLLHVGGVMGEAYCKSWRVILSIYMATCTDKQSKHSQNTAQLAAAHLDVFASHSLITQTNAHHSNMLLKQPLLAAAVALPQPSQEQMHQLAAAFDPVHCVYQNRLLWQ
jgi:hypothetical protein